ncbi:YdbL family protein [Microbulbifer taiwanensis]|uniref:YdbL family protein n=1 Tax=Microbulbifer taiwanensis TaxID=986746 RepID=A0ABW1YRG4_9GAMM|nr:YdbL family protein [Microbulbifer taiwanensis]
MKIVKTALLFLSLVIALPAMAITLNEAKGQGLVGEANSGYIAVVSQSSAELEKLVANVNAKRKAEYARIAKRNNIDIAQVAARAAEKLEARLAPGEYYQDNRGRWAQK